jgi:hypothetical protein
MGWLGDSSSNRSSVRSEYIQCCYDLQIVSANCCIAYVFRLLHVRRLVVTMASCSEQVDRLPVWMSSAQTVFSTLVVPDDDSGYAVQNIITPVM